METVKLLCICFGEEQITFNKSGYLKTEHTRGISLIETLQINLKRISLDIWWLQTMNLVVFLRGQCT